MLDALRTAKAWGAVPSVILGTGLPAWCEEDRLLALALTLHDADLCPGGCGYYLDETRNQDGFHHVETEYCGACAARDEHQREARGIEPLPGEMIYIALDA